jgi:hypothetical protein
MKLRITNEDATRVAKITTCNGATRTTQDVAPGASLETYLHQTCSLFVEEKAEDIAAAALGAPDHIMQFFAFEHLPPHLQMASRPFADLAKALVQYTPRNPERTVALRKLLEAKDAAVRALLATDPAK